MKATVKFLMAFSKLALIVGLSMAGGFRRSHPSKDGAPGVGGGAIVVTRPLNANAHHGATTPGICEVGITFTWPARKVQEIAAQSH
jgi:hypothetical protein